MQTQRFLPINIYSDSFFLKKIEFNFGSNFGPILSPVHGSSPYFVLCPGLMYTAPKTGKHSMLISSNDVR